MDAITAVAPVNATAQFYTSVPLFRSFDAILDPAVYRPLPDDWLIGLTDVIGSTGAIAAGRYKAVNTAGASAIAAVTNALGRSQFPFVFGGDGATFAVAPSEAGKARAALAATAVFVAEEIGLGLRVAMVSVRDIRAAGHDVEVSRFAASADVAYAMFSGGGLSWAEERMKQGDFAIAPAPPGTRPDLAGLSCRWSPIEAKRGVILSLIVAPGAAGDAGFRAAVERLVHGIGESEAVGRPVATTSGPPIEWPPQGFDLEARSLRKPGKSLFASKLGLGLNTLLAYAIFKLGVRIGGFDPARYLGELVANADFRKFDDSLRMTLDCTSAFAADLAARLEEARRQGLLRYGLHSQTQALMTCIVPNVLEANHVHFIDGADGGYAAAARALKQAD